ncbi:ABC transporter ATP-binding protein/permease [Alphaproteobacteria bacterium]|nr:ABC transporter ATP-binding protein/permease [Alphaproteobacteria bacterium]
MELYKLINAVLIDSEKKELLFLFFGSIVMGLFEMVGIVSVVPFIMVASDISLVSSNQYLSLMYVFLGADSANDFIVILGFILIVLMIISNTFNAYIVWRITKFSYMQGCRISERLLSKHLSKNYVYFLGKNVSDIVKTILTEVDRAVSGVLLPLLGMSSKIISVLIILAMLMFYNPLLTVISVFFLSFAYIILYIGIRKKILRLGQSSTELIGKRYRVVYESMSGIKDVIMKNLSSEMLSRYSKSSKQYAEVSALGNAFSELPRYALELVIFGGLVTLVIHQLVYDSENLFIATLSLYAIAGIRLMPSAQLIFRAFSTVRYHTPVLKNIVKDLQDDLQEAIQCEQKISKIKINKSIQMNNIEYSYPNSKNKILKEFNMNIKSNSIVGIVGSSGSGKTTLINILLGLIVPDTGDILIDGKKLTGKNILSWRKSIGYVPQDVFVSDNSIINNITFGRNESEADFPLIREVITLAELDHFVQSIKGGYNGSLGERGSKMSGGQRQRLGIARALYTKPSIIVFDEATSALDGITEKKIMDSIYNLKKNHIIIMVAHRVTTLKRCNIIYFLENGQIKDSGTYKYLLKNNLTFRQMAEQKFETVTNINDGSNIL